ncbi:hypothetical protein C8Q80DRAFT_1180229 [Daedaleopsis nitida]|nr:hypothetical protein C8Q80DRAFT_1180229 [Daedaleopsis nitida]
MTSMALHWHEHFEDWMYILEAGDGAVLLVWEPGQERSMRDIIPREEGIKTGDFLGFPAGVERAHALRAGTTELVYLVGGNRGPFDVCHYPMEGKKTETSVDEARGMFKGETKDEDRFAASDSTGDGVAVRHHPILTLHTSTNGSNILS